MLNGGEYSGKMFWKSVCNIRWSARAITSEKGETMKQIKTKRNQEESTPNTPATVISKSPTGNFEMGIVAMVFLFILGMAIGFYGVQSDYVSLSKYESTVNQTIALEQQLNQTKIDTMKIVSVALVSINQTQNCVANFNTYQQDVTSTLCTSPGFEINCANGSRVSWKSAKVI
jgi:uncharacterized protein HemX